MLRFVPLLNAVVQPKL